MVLYSRGCFMAVPNLGINTPGFYGGLGSNNGSYYNPLGQNALLTSYGGLNHGAYGGGAYGGGAFGGGAYGGGAFGGGASLASGLQALVAGGKELISAFSKIREAGGIQAARDNGAWENSGAERPIV